MNINIRIKTIVQLFRALLRLILSQTTRDSEFLKLKKFYLRLELEGRQNRVYPCTCMVIRSTIIFYGRK